jgi:glyoxylase-like metal-dependent hydrolase (beta-lactamase superfamily II)
MAIGIAIVLPIALSGAAAGRQRDGTNGATLPDTVAKARPLKSGFFLITGGGANTGVRVTSEGLIVVDSKNPGDDVFAALTTQLKSISPLPVKFILNTCHDPDHVGNNGKLVELGATVIGTDALGTEMAIDARTAPIMGRPTITFARDYIMVFGDVTVEAHHFGNAHTVEDAVVYFPDLKIAMIGDMVTDTNPVLDRTGGSILGWKTSLDRILQLDFDIATPSRGEPRPKADVQAFKTKIDAVIDRGNAAIKAGATKDTFMARVKIDDLGWTEPKAFFDSLYDELTKTPH